jgi:ATP-dependent DNA ligase
LVVVSGREEAKGAPLPGFIEPCLAEARLTLPSTDQWVHEINLDGFAAWAGRISLYTPPIQ